MSNVVSLFLSLSLAGFILFMILGFFLKIAEFFLNIIKIMLNKRLIKLLAILILPIIVIFSVADYFDKLKTKENIRIYKKHSSEGLEIEYFDNIEQEKHIWD